MPDKSIKALLVDDDSEFADDFGTLLPDYMKCAWVNNVAEADRYLHENDVDVLFLDIDLGSDGNGLDFLKELKIEFPYLPVIMITADQKIDSVVKALHLGASDYIGKSPDLGVLKLSIERAISKNRLQKQYDFLESEFRQKFADLVGESRVMQRIKDEIRRLARVSSSVLITGPSGTGKELVARSIHRLSDRRNQPFVAVNCAALSRELIESELFGHEKGAFTGAHSQRTGKFEVASGGTLFLDEITEIPIEVQAKFLRVLQENEFERVGGNRLIDFQGRILASSNRDVDQAVKEGRLRQDLLFRLDVSRLTLPPLNERKEDIPLLVDYYVRQKSQEIKKTVTGITEGALDALCLYGWPGNVRELANCIENAIVHTEKEKLDINDFTRLAKHRELITENYEESKKRFLLDFQRDYIGFALKKSHGNISAAAQQMGVSRQGLIKMMKACGLSQDE